MKLFMVVCCVIPTIVAPITISSNGNSPEIKMIGGMMVEVQKEFTPMAMQTAETATVSNYDRSKKLKLNSTKLSINERYRRLIPYMTFYYANDLSSTTEADSAKTVEVEKAEIIEAKTLEPPTQRQQKKIIYAPHRSIPRYQGNRLTQFNIESANPTKVYYKQVPAYQQSPKVNYNFNPISTDIPFGIGHQEYDYGRFVQKQVYKNPILPQPTTTRKPYLNFYNNDEQQNFPYYFSNKEQGQNFKLIPYEQTPPIKVSPYNENIYENKKPIPVPVLVPKDPVYIKSRPPRPQYIYENVQQTIPRKPVVVSENYYEKRRPSPAVTQTFTEPVIEGGFKPIINGVVSTEAPTYTTILPATPSPIETIRKPTIKINQHSPVPVEPITEYKENYYQYVVEKPIKPEQYAPIAPPQPSLSDLLNSLQLNKSVPKPITRENVGSSIQTLLQVLNALKAVTQQNEVEPPQLSTPKPFVAPQVVVEMTPRTVAVSPPEPVADADLHDEPYLAHVNTPSQHLDGINNDLPLPPGTTSQRFPPPVHSDDEGGTPGRPGVDYPTLPTIPPTSFDCKTQRYKGFFADPETRCQVWHYCDLNGGQASFLCPNGTIFSQAGLTCDWWFNVRCASTTQLYVLNESLYKFILPHSPKFPEDYSGPLVDKYLTLKFKEMEEQFRKNKNKQNATEKADSSDDEDTSEDPDEKGEVETSSQRSEDSIDHELSTVSEASVVVESPGTSGNVQRLED